MSLEPFFTRLGRVIVAATLVTALIVITVLIIN